METHISMRKKPELSGLCILLPSFGNDPLVSSRMLQVTLASSTAQGWEITQCDQLEGLRSSGHSNWFRKRYAIKSERLGDVLFLEIHLYYENV